MSELLLNSAISEKESIEMFMEGLSMAASRAREMGNAQRNEIWLDIAKLMDEMRNKGFALAKSKGLNRQEALGMIQDREDRHKKAQSL